MLWSLNTVLLLLLFAPCCFCCSAVALHHDEISLPAGAPQHRADSAVAAACDHNEASVFPSAPQQSGIWVVGAVVSHYGEDSVAVGGQHCTVSAAAVRHYVVAPIWVAANQQCFCFCWNLPSG